MDRPDIDRPDALQARVREMLGIRAFRRPPAAFEPMSAKARALRAYGYPARPNPKTQPRLHELWTQVVSQPIHLIEPEFAVMQDKARGAGTRYGPPAGNGWGGAIAFAPEDDTITFVSGQWTVPHIVSPRTGNFICASWVGIDGANDDPHGRESYDILQAGTTQMILSADHWYGDSFEYDSFAWFEWYPAAPVTISNLKVSPGDTIQCTICVYSPTEAGIHLLNMTTRVGTSFIKTAPGSTQLVGNSAEWVIETPPSSNMGLGRFGETFFDGCAAGTQGGQLLLGGDGSMLSMYDVDGHDIAVPNRETDLLVRIRYTDANP
jgi:Peptidase A4 family